jgi:transcription-repair coupling factor (superfamily II helicase)
VFDFDTIEKIRVFDTETQATIESAESLLVCPMKEVLWTPEFIQQARAFLDQERERGKVNPDADKAADRLIAELETAGESEGEELYYPLLFGAEGGAASTILDYLTEDDFLFFLDYDRLENAQANLEKEYAGSFHREGAQRILPPPARVLLPFTAFTTDAATERKCVYFRTLARGDSNGQPTSAPFTLDMDPPRSFFGNITYLKETIEDLTANGWTIFVFGETENQALRIGEILRDVSSVVILPKSLSSGFGIPELKVLVVNDNEIFGRRKRALRSFNRSVKSAVIDTFVELSPGDFVVHVNHGIGLFEGIERVKAAGHERDYIKLRYADEETVFIPIEQANLVQRYIGNKGDSPRLDTIGSKLWESRKNRVKKSVEEIAQKLIDLYSRRKASRGFPFPRDTEWQTAFEAAFPWEETPDQLTAAEDVKRDMEAPVPMDRLLCGDVGFGKTEVAFRAAFKAVMGGKQVAFLAPTTLLAEQHYETCLERFEQFPVRAAHLSRMIPRAEQKRILERVSRGEIDILIGTHRIIQRDVVFKDLGLMVVDEEQRFGVKDKERLKELKANIDCISLSATPIPRTLHMSLLKIRDMSLLATPPENRQAIETVIDAYSDERVADAIRAEAARGGQVFFLHNRIESLEETRIRLQHLLPEMLIGTAHGQMASDELDDVFRRFKMGGYHVLVATTIVENGIDIPNVNTIIIDRADMYGVSQLYQLRGRVGRSDRKAYAYLLYPRDKALTEIAMKRLQVISDFTELGSGFKIAMKDMEIRGAGNLLGRDQSGDVYSVGFDLYLRLLEEAIQRLSDENFIAEEDVLMELEYTGFIPDTYISNPQIKMEVYKRIAALMTREEIDSFTLELQDRFGDIPVEVSSLLALAEIRALCKKLAVSAIKERNGVAHVEFSRVADISVEKVVRLIAESNGKIKPDTRKPNVLIIETGNIALTEKSEYLREKLEALQG